MSDDTTEDIRIWGRCYCDYHQAQVWWDMNDRIRQIYYQHELLHQAVRHKLHVSVDSIQDTGCLANSRYQWKDDFLDELHRQVKGYILHIYYQAPYSAASTHYQYKLYDQYEHNFRATSFLPLYAVTSKDRLEPLKPRFVALVLSELRTHVDGHWEVRFHVRRFREKMTFVRQTLTPWVDRDSLSILMSYLTNE